MGIRVHKSAQNRLRMCARVRDTETDICTYILNNHYVNIKTAALQSLYRP